ncbi:MAG: GAF domain-containing protein [Alistipes sp.]|nr:GAF domain-containing protein [Alistipes sp.]
MTADNRETVYKELLPQLRALLEGESRPLPCMANICAILKENFGFFWVGFYIVDGDELVLGPFQGPVACMIIGKGRGVCGAARERKETVIIPDVEEFPGHIACNPLSRSEIVVPLMDGEEVVAVLDIDSSHLDDFSSTDARYLSEMVSMPFVGNIKALYP